MDNRPHYWQLLPYIRRQQAILIPAFICTLVFTIYWPILAKLGGLAISALVQGQVATFGRIAAVTLIGLLIQKAAQYGQDSLMAKAAFRVAHQLRTRIYSHLQTLSLTYFEQTKTGDLAYRLTEDVDRIGEVVYKLFHDFVPSALQLVVIFGYMIYLNWQLTATALILVPLLAVLSGWFGEKMLTAARRSQDKVADLSSQVAEVFSGIRLVQAFAAEDYEIKRFSHASANNRDARYSVAWLQAVQFPVVGFLYAGMIVILLLVGTWQISLGNLAREGFGTYVINALLLIDPVNHVIQNFNEFKQGEASIDRVLELFHITPLVQNAPGATPLPAVTGQVDYRDVSFAYEPKQPVLDHVNLSAAPGQTIALVGLSGAGKTTLVNLLSRFYNVATGEVLIDGVNIQQVTLQSLRRQIGIVPQETILFSGTLAENIAFGQADFDLANVKSAAQAANAHDFISQSAQGYHTWVGERGVNLSGGQRQRIAIARAILFNPKILILDEATSALDAESEALVQEALERLMQGRTVFVIAHRLATVRRCDRILVMEKGRIIESGTHTELLHQAGRYASFYTKQFQL
ncbi:ABC transporter ATP-binding protein [Leptolyngbya cf. ectocarpi LEGE 11479]|uniref:ABC transporter ATP-binding protein n=1 Tax=Leptolyngbya cf. ectocarpi LEGE 11479 TaxID=1828722 RepID=A0A928ZUF8_LEPEC|nr:ABC transporter ATP-binding protein [Leptolyngbya ectocarpi]MBE9067663.1 ABC transporter ATP-binding protein [Leptolyngbya cf. ectocarpi LEGE 11479]